MTPSKSAQAWLDATIDAAQEFCETTIGSPLGERAELRELPQLLTGCFVAIVSPDASVQVGVASDAPGCQSLACALFAAEEELSESDISDALGEIANVVAGGVKKRRHSDFQGMSLGLPIVMDGQVRCTDSQEVVQTEVAFADVPVRLIVVSNRGS